MSAREVITEVWQAGREDFHHTTTAQKALLAGAAIGLAAEWSATEVSLIAVSNAVLDATHNPTVTALATGGTSFVEQAALGLLTVASIRNFPVAFASVRANRELHRDQKRIKQEVDNTTLESSTVIIPHVKSEPGAVEPPVRAGPSFLRRFGDAFALGTSLNALVKNSNDEYSDTQNVRNVASDAGLIGLGVTAIFGVGTEVFSEPVATEILSSPWTYAVVLTAVVGSRVIENIRKPKNDNE